MDTRWTFLGMCLLCPPTNIAAEQTPKATLVLLLGVSTFIIVRSYFIRRRVRRQFEDALVPQANSPGGGGIHLNHRKVSGPKPKMWEVRLHKSVEGEWGTIMPLSAEIVIPPPPSMPPHRRIGSSSSLSLLKRFQAKRSASTLTTVQTPTTPLPSPSIVSEQESSHNLLVTTLIAMPSPSRSNSTSSPLLKGKQREEGGEGVPPVMFGTVEVFLNWDREVPTPASEEVKAGGSLVDGERTASA